MTIDKNIFFREATFKICGSLEIETALWRCLLYIRKYIPVAQMNLHLYEQGLGIVETVAHATPECGRSMSIKIPFSSKSRKLLEGLRSIRLKTYKDPEQIDTLKEFVSKLEMLGFSSDQEFVFLDLVIEKKFIGVLSVVYEKDREVSPFHLELLGQLNEPFSIALSNSLRFREVGALKDLIADDSRYFQEELRRMAGEEIIGADFGLRNVMDMVRQVALLDSPVLLRGETGVGKEIIAGAIHSMSTRRQGPFIKVNCGAIPDSLMDSELFGHEIGAFTGAVTLKRGRFERAQGGTIFLDEIGELSPDAQVRLLRVLQEKEIERVGGVKTIKLDIRVVAATHRDLELMLSENLFREDLYYRLKVFPIVIPPLRDRITDIPSLVQHFILKKTQEMKRLTVPTLSPGAIDTLISYHWPGNVRELENVVERTMILSQENPLTFEPIGIHQEGVEKLPKESGVRSYNLNLAIARQIRKALKTSGGKVHGKGGAAELLGVNYGTLRHRMKKLGIPFGRKAKKRTETK